MDNQKSDGHGLNKFYLIVAKISGWGSAAAFALAFVNKILGREWLFTPSDLFQAALYLVLFAIFASMSAISTKQ